MIEGSVVIRDAKVATCAVASFGDDEVNGAFDVGVIAVNRSGDVAVADGGGEVISETPLEGKALVDVGGVSSGDGWDVLSSEAKCLFTDGVHDLNEGACRGDGMNAGARSVGAPHVRFGWDATEDG